MCKFNPKNDSRRIDICLKNIVNILNFYGIKTVACCCGHGKYSMTIVIECQQSEIQRWLEVKPLFLEIFSKTFIERKKRFYKKDKQGIYYIPEVLENAQ